MSNEQKEKQKAKAFDFKLAKRIFSYTRPYRNKFYAALLITLLLSALTISRPLLVKYTIDHFFVNKEAAMLTQMTLILLFALIAEALLQYANIYLTSFIGQNIIRDMRKQVFEHIVKFKTRYFDTTAIGTLVTRSVSDIESLADVFSQGFIVILGDILTLIVFVVAMLLQNWQFALIVLTTIPMLLLATNMFKNGVKSTFNEVRNAVAALNTFVQEHIQGMKIVQVFNREKEEYEKFRKINEQHKKANIRSIWYYSVFFPIVEILSAVSIGLLIWYAGYKAGKINISPGELSFFLMLTNMLFRPIRMMADRINTLQMGMVASERVFKVLDTDDVISNDGNYAPAQMKGEVSFEEVWFAYQEQDYVLKGLNLKVNAGEMVAIVGATGAGKSSIVNLLSRYYEYNKGDIKIDGVAVRDYELNNLRSHISVVLQDVFLFSDTIENNITLNNPAISHQQVEAAARAVGAHEFIMSLPGNYSYNVRERGAMLSVGQRQLIAFIRAYVHNPSILVLDEATSSIDTISEQMIQHAIGRLTENRTSIIIAHRLATIQKAHKVIVLEKGEIMEQGTLKELLARNGQFKRLYDLQFSETTA